MIEPRLQSIAFGEIASHLIESGHGFRFRAHGRSMLPAIQDGELLHVLPLGNRKLKIGDIVLFRASDGFKAHRIVRNQREHFITRGDSGLETDGAVSRDQIVGVVVAKECARSLRVVRLNGLTPRLAFRLREMRKEIRLSRVFATRQRA